MALKRKTKIADTFSMASMTDVIFLLLIFFLVTSTIIVPNTIKVTLPTSAPQSAPETPSVRITLTPDLRYYMSIDRSAPVELTQEALKEQLGIFAAEHPEAFVSIQADEQVPYKEVVAVINAAARASLKVVLATRAETDPTPAN
ncbi:biopolymer transporter ExbD [Porphyromonas sp. oral taxon 278]|jgi:biopolymer transport protein exbD, putative|uniref:ExbD/TolR family protein n=1 Tax=Porphyromonas sp. oral taxon 278 TaxID=712437 RepID=UPI0025DC5145|nr:biopolymer transporter ExbD [Porphyromonas sp. oral taxon 278]